MKEKHVESSGDTHIRLSLDLYLSDIWGSTREEVINNLDSHYDDLGHLVAELYIPNDTSYAKVYNPSNLPQEPPDNFTTVKERTNTKNDQT